LRKSRRDTILAATWQFQAFCATCISKIRADADTILAVKLYATDKN
jgi:hypothetical protein